MCAFKYKYEYVCIYIYICKYVYMYTPIYVYIFKYMHISLYVYLYMQSKNVYMQICIYVKMCTCIYVYKCICIFICMCKYIYIYVCMYGWMDGWMDVWMYCISIYIIYVYDHICSYSCDDIYPMISPFLVDAPRPLTRRPRPARNPRPPWGVEPSKLPPRIMGKWWENLENLVNYWRILERCEKQCKSWKMSN